MEASLELPEDWDKTIGRELEEADVIVLMWSTQFEASDCRQNCVWLSSGHLKMAQRIPPFRVASSDGQAHGWSLRCCVNDSQG
ncbi:MAG: hypothetical protein FJ398_15120 [Verrucomicrobia bacterium]|nr:hypothetical protein [Verrucomicrobiota bacterium]